MFDNMFAGCFGKIKPGCCRLSFNGKIAIKTSDGYKVYNPSNGNVVNCSNFVLSECDDMFMVIPTRKLKVGDIVLINGKPMYIIEVKAKNRVEAMNYEDSTIQTVIPERHAIMGRRFYGKIVSLIGSGFGSNKGSFFKNMLKLKMMSSMMSGSSSTDNMFGGNGLAMMMLMGNGSMDGLFDGFMDDEDDEDGSESSIFEKLVSTDEDESEDDEDEVHEKPVAKKTTKKNVKKIKRLR